MTDKLTLNQYDTMVEELIRILGGDEYAHKLYYTEHLLKELVTLPKVPYAEASFRNDFDISDLENRRVIIRGIEYWLTYPPDFIRELKNS